MLSDWCTRLVKYPVHGETLVGILFLVVLTRVFESDGKRVLMGWLKSEMRRKQAKLLCGLERKDKGRVKALQ